MNKPVDFTVNILKQYAGENGEIVRGTTDLSPLEQWLIMQLYKLYKRYPREEYDPYFGWCDVEGCNNEASSGGTCWRSSGYWWVCSNHADDFRDGKAQPKMKQKAIDKENSRDKEAGYLPSVDNEEVINKIKKDCDDGMQDWMNASLGKKIET